MKINWKLVAASPAYKSMKAAVVDEAKHAAKWGRKPDERYEKAFNFAINRAKHYAVYQNNGNFNLTQALIDVLTKWEERRDYDFISFYSNHNLPKFHSNSVKLKGVRWQLKNCKTSHFYRNDPVQKQKRILSIIIGQQKANSKKVKPRWNAERRKARERYGV